ncbi:MAG: lmo0937 family membrane protein [Myxococcales bacterium]|nr:lmo0937 family membrane protein [Myxococcales bacterium]
MLLTIALLFFVAWILGFGVFHVASFAIHVLVILALVSIVLHFVRGRRAGS